MDSITKEIVRLSINIKSRIAVGSGIIKRETTATIKSATELVLSLDFIFILTQPPFLLFFLVFILFFKVINKC